MPNVEQCQAEREAKRQIVLGSKYYKSNDRFTSADIAGQLTITVQQARRLLAHMIDVGDIIKLSGHRGNTYRRKQRPLNTIDWRHNKSIYREIEHDRV